jgi:hypothetical protein
MSASLDQARAAKQKVKELLADRAVINGVGISSVNERYAVKVNMTRPPTADDAIPTQVDGVPVNVEVVGNIRKLGI